MKRTKYILTIFAAFLFLLTGCGGQEAEETFVYTSTIIWDDIGSIGNSKKEFAAAGDSLYYLLQHSNYTHTICKMPLTDIGQNTESAQEETVLTTSDIRSAIPIEELNIEIFDIDDLMDDTEGIEERIAEGIIEERADDILDYVVDAEGGIYCVAVLYGTTGMSKEYILYKQSPKGEMAYWMELPEIEANYDMALDGDGKVYVLTGGTILAVDKNGKRAGSLSVEYELQLGRKITGRLLEGDQGDVYYTVEKTYDHTRETFIINETGTLQMTKISKLSGRMDMGLCGDRGGLLQLSGEMLYRYHRADDSLTPILSWQYSNLQQSDIREVIRIDGEHYFVMAVAANGLQERGLLLTKAEEGADSEKETIVIASLFPSSELKRSAAEFNRLNDNYFVLIESYGADIYGGAANEGAYVRLDSALVSKDGPDILDLSDLDISKYTENGALEDLRPYLEESDAGGLDYPDRLLEGYTINGRLVCIPKAVYFRPVFAVSPETASLESWTLPQLMRLTEEHPDMRLFDYLWQPDAYLLEEFCAPYYLEEFVDWESRTCSFDSEEFYSLLDWIKDQSEKSGQEGDALLAMAEIHNFLDSLRVVLEYGEETSMIGCPSADGKGVYSAVAEESLAILSGSRHKEGAWEFLQYFLSEGTDGSDFPTRRELLDEMALDAVTPLYVLDMEGNPSQDEEGNPVISPKGAINVGGVMVEFYALEQGQADEVMRLIESADYTPRNAEAQGIVDMISEEAQYFFDGSKSAEEVCDVIQNKAQLLLQERGVQ